MFETLRVSDDLRCVKGLLHVVDQTTCRLRGRGAGQDARRFHTLRFLTRQHASEDGLRDAGQRNPELERGLAGPPAGAFLLGLVLDAIHQGGAASIFVLGEDIGRDLDQVRLQASFIPFAKHGGELVRRETESVTQQVVRLGDQLDVGVLDPVVDHLYEMPGAVRSDVSAAGDTVDFRRDRGQHLFDALVGLTRPARHEARAVQRALFPAGNAASQKSEADLLERSAATLRVLKKGVAAVDDHVALVEGCGQLIDHVIDRPPGIHQHGHRARRFQDTSELLEGRGGNEVAFLGVIGNELFGAPMRAVVDGHAHAVRREIAREATAYGAEPDDPHLLLGHAATLLR